LILRRPRRGRLEGRGGPEGAVSKDEEAPKGPSRRTRKPFKGNFLLAFVLRDGGYAASSN
ncbi:MAG: hypothetical protein ACRECN_02800, partial [Methylocella sp.]